MTAPAEGMLAGVRVLDLADDPGARAARILGDLGADVVRVVPSGGDPLDARPEVAASWNAGKSVAALGPDAPDLDDLLAGADVVIDSPGRTDLHVLDPARAPHAVWVRVTPFGLDGPRAGWRASDLGIMAASGNMFCTGDPDRAPVRCTEPTAYCHGGPEVAFAALGALHAGRTGVVDCSLAESVLVANMGTHARFPIDGNRGRRVGANIGRSREIWPTADGYVSFGLRGGKARVPTLELLTRLVVADGVAGADALATRDWTEFNHNTVTDDELCAIEAPLAAYFARHTMRELFAIACEHNAMLAPINTPPELLASEQLAARGFLRPLGDLPAFPSAFVTTRARDGGPAPVGPRRPAARAAPGAAVGFGPRDAPRGTPRSASTSPPPGAGLWHGTRILEFGSGAAGPIAARYFVEQGATVLRVESKQRPDFLRVYALGPANPHGLEGSAMYDSLNVGKRNVTFHLKDPRAVALVRRLVVEWADAVAENFAPRAMRGFGLDYDTLAAERPDLVMVSACLNGQTGPHRDYPGFGSQGAALSGFNALTGWPDREPVGPHATITDSLAPRYVACALAAGLWYRRATGRGVHLDVSQVETGIWSLTPWIVRHVTDGVVTERMGNRHEHAVPHGAFPCAPEGDVDDRWVAIAAWTDDEWARLADRLGIDDPDLATFAGRAARVDEVEALVAAWTRERTRAAVAETLQALGVEAVPVADFGDLHDDPQLVHRGHWVPGEHPATGPRLYERNGYRAPDDAGGYHRVHGPLLGQDNAWVLGELLGLGADEIAALEADGVLS